MAKRDRLHQMGSRVLTGMVIFLAVEAGWTFSVKPGAQIVRAKPGHVMDISYEVINDTDTPLTVSCQVSKNFVTSENKAFPLDQWLVPAFKEIHVPPMGSAKAPFKANIPRRAKGELSALVSFSPIFPDVSKSTAASAAIQTRIVITITSSLYVRIEGTERGEADVAAVGVTNRVSRNNPLGNLRVSVLVKNKGNVHQRPSGTFAIYTRQTNALLYNLSFPSGWPVMPYDEMSYSAESLGTLPPGDFRLRTRVVFAPNVAIEKDTAFTINPLGEATNYYEIPAK